MARYAVRLSHVAAAHLCRYAIGLPCVHSKCGGRSVGRLVNFLLRLSILYFLAEALRSPDDPRFAGKAIAPRNVLIVTLLGLALPGLHLFRKRWVRYPFWLDNLYLSIFWLDMAGNSFNLYDRFFYFDLIPHCHGSGAGTVFLSRALGLNTLSAIGLANMLHLLLEGQEYYTDVFFGTHNVRGESDIINDLLSGLLGTVAYGLIHSRWNAGRSTR